MAGRAVIVVDLVNDFVRGVFGNERGEATARQTQAFLKEIGGNVPVIFTMDNHLVNDPEFKVWKEHCIVGTSGSQLVEELQSFDGYRVPKRHFDSFFDSDLDGILRANSVSHVYVIGISTDICVLHTVAGAFFRNYSITVLSDLCSSMEENAHDRALSDMARNYGARIMKSGEVLEELA